MRASRDVTRLSPLTSAATNVAGSHGRLPTAIAASAGVILSSPLRSPRGVIVITLLVEFVAPSSCPISHPFCLFLICLHLYSVTFKTRIEHISVCGFPWALAPQYAPQTRAGLSSVFGMGTGVSPPLWPMYSHRAYNTIWISPEPEAGPRAGPVHPVDLVKQDHPVRMLVVAD